MRSVSPKLRSMAHALSLKFCSALEDYLEQFLTKTDIPIPALRDPTISLGNLVQTSHLRTF